ncbi:hypothetical protein BDZ89DRAFT_1149665 [Hymenopellis radicata]|nr:hypothetical protein BDZ89DRAFT_1149665 [Hymenopellis radicata]
MRNLKFGQRIPGAISDRHHPRWAEGWRASFLNERLWRYTDALETSHECESLFLKALYKEYFYYCPVSVADTEEPVLPEEPWEENKVYPAEKLTPEEMAVKRERMKILKKRIRGYLRYRAQKLWQVRSSVRHRFLDDGFVVLLGKLSGITKPPKARQAFQQWWTTNKESISKEARSEYERVCDELKKNHVPEAQWPVWKVDFHSEYARKTFKAMSKEEQAEWGKAVKDEAAQAKEEYVWKMTSKPSQEPKERAAFLAPILEGIHDLTGLHVVVSVAGPMPHRAGEHAVISAASGVNLEPDTVAATH